MSEAAELRVNARETCLRLSAAIAAIEHVLVAHNLTTVRELNDLSARYVTGLDQEIAKRTDELSEHPHP